MYYSLFVSFSNFWPRNKLQKLSLLYFVVYTRDEFSSSFAVIYTHISVSTHAWAHFPIKCHRETHKTQVLIDNSHAIRASLTRRCHYLDWRLIWRWICNHEIICFFSSLSLFSCKVLFCGWRSICHHCMYPVSPWNTVFNGFSLERLSISTQNLEMISFALYMGNIQMLSSVNPLVVHRLETKIF